MIYEELKTGFRIYDSIQKQDRLLKAGDSEDFSFHLYSPSNALLPFQFKISGITSTISGFKIYSINGALAYNLTANISQIERVKTSDGVTYFTYKGGLISGLNMVSGLYYIQLTDSTSKTYYSEVFFVPCDLLQSGNSRYLKLEWWNSCDLAVILYQTGFRNVLYLDTTISKEQPTIEEEGEEDGHGDFHADFQKLVDNLYFEDVVPYNVAESLTVATMHNNIVLTTPNGVYSGVIKNAKTTTAQQENSEKYLFTMTFQQDTPYIVTGCCKNMALVS